MRLTNSNCLWDFKKKNIDFQIYVRELSLLYSFKIHVPILIYKNLMITSLKLPDSDWLHGKMSIDRNIKKGGIKRENTKCNYMYHTAEKWSNYKSLTEYVLTVPVCWMRLGMSLFCREWATLWEKILWLGEIVT